MTASRSAPPRGSERPPPARRNTPSAAELVEAGLDRSYPTLVRERGALSCVVCEHHRGAQVTVEVNHPAGEEIQWDWLELHDTP